MAPKAPPLKKIAVFAEGSDYTDPKTQRAPFVELWKTLCTRLAATPADIRIVPFNKLQIELLGAEVKQRAAVSAIGNEPLDILLDRMYRREKFDIAIIAFDRTPPNKILQERKVQLCLRSEVNFVLERIVAREFLHALPFHEEAKRLLAYYKENPQQERGPGRPPRGCLDLLYMDPEFEGIFVHDEKTVRSAMEIKRSPKDWPKFDKRAHYPARDILAKAVAFAPKDVAAKAGSSGHHVNQRWTQNSHGWARWILNQADPDARLFQHPIAQRLRTLLV